ncbi:unnamed protein product [Blepharisma stoltei]|uniref:Uncharacterized protein n=1 Tax=Blepharisma stoltei TaxID=1481888 RepID=A0AAU9J7T6_9CILI|nr:unnamed protein product [Blepharisma stoltei]
MSKLTINLSETVVTEPKELLSQSSINSNTQDYQNLEDSAYGMKDALLVKWRDTVENLYEEIELQKRQRREAELWCKELEVKNQSIEKRNKELSTKVLAYKEENELVKENKENIEKELSILKTSGNKHTQQISIIAQENEELKRRIEIFKEESMEKNKALQDLNLKISTYEAKTLKLENENSDLKSEIEEWQTKYDDLVYKCERLTAQAKIAETVTVSLKQAQEDYQKCLREEKEMLENKENEMKEKYNEFEAKLKKRYAMKESELKQELTRSIEEIQRTVEISSEEHNKVRNENISLKDYVKNLQEELAGSKIDIRALEDARQEIDTLTHLLEDKTSLCEKQEITLEEESLNFKNRLEEAQQVEANLRNLLSESHETIENLKQSLLNEQKLHEESAQHIIELEEKLENEQTKAKEKEIEISKISENEKELSKRLSKIRETHLQEIKNILESNDEKINQAKAKTKQKYSKEYQKRLDMEKEKNNISEKEILRLKNILETQEQKLEAVMKEKQILEDALHEFREQVTQITAHQSMHRTQSEEISNQLNSQLVSLNHELGKEKKHRLHLEQKMKQKKTEFQQLQEKIKQDSSFFKHEIARKDEELMKLKRRFEAKLREMCGEVNLKNENIRGEMLKIISEMKEDSCEEFECVLENLEDLVYSIPAYSC